jgi:hypothetical protein
MEQLNIPQEHRSTLRGLSALDDLERGRFYESGAVSTRGVPLVPDPRLETGDFGERERRRVRLMAGVDATAEGPALLVARRLGATGHATLEEQFSAHGTLAPQTMGRAQQRTTLQERNRRIGEIFRRLDQAASSAEILKEPGGGGLHKLAQAVNNWLRAKSPEAIETARERLVAELLALLASYD